MRMCPFWNWREARLGVEPDDTRTWDERCRIVIFVPVTDPRPNNIEFEGWLRVSASNLAGPVSARWLGRRRTRSNTGTGRGMGQRGAPTSAPRSQHASAPPRWFQARSGRVLAGRRARRCNLLSYGSHPAAQPRWHAGVACFFGVSTTNRGAFRVDPRRCTVL